MTLRRVFRCWLLRKHRWGRKQARGDEEYWECRDCGEMFTGAMPTGESKYRAPFGMQFGCVPVHEHEWRAREGLVQPPESRVAVYKDQHARRVPDWGYACQQLRLAALRRADPPRPAAAVGSAGD